jgi:hypothetical protein
MNFLIAETFTDSLARLTGEEQKAVKTTAFDLQAVREAGVRAASHLAGVSSRASSALICGRRPSTYLRYSSGLMPCILQFWMTVNITAFCQPPLSEPKNNQFFLPIAQGRTAFSTALLSISISPLPTYSPKKDRRIMRRVFVCHFGAVFLFLNNKNWRVGQVIWGGEDRKRG